MELICLHHSCGQLVFQEVCALFGLLHEQSGAKHSDDEYESVLWGHGVGLWQLWGLAETDAMTQCSQVAGKLPSYAAQT